MPEAVARPVPAQAAPIIAREPVMAAAVEPEPAEPEFADPEEDDFSIASVAGHLATDDVRVAISVSPAGDGGSANAVTLARLVAEDGRKIVLIDLTGSACPTQLMTQTADLAGITNLLVGEVPFTETIHADRLSDAHIIPQGDADPVVAMRGIERLQMIIDALANAYDTVLIECGPADVNAISRVTRARDTQIIISAPDVGNEEIIDLITGFGEAGFGEIVLMTGTGYPQSGTSGRKAA
jgi:Mrp family chromosome partitioning ATPase